MSNKLGVLVTGVGGRSVGHQILHALKKTDDRYKMVATDVEPFSFGLYQTTHHYIVPRASAKDYVPTIMGIVEREKISVILPGTEAEVRILGDARSIFEQAGCFVIASPADVIRTCNDKGVLQGWLEQNGFGVPRSASGKEWQDLVLDVGFPIIGKPTTMSGGSKGVAILNDEKEVFRYLADVGTPLESLLFQEYVGDADSEYTVGVLVSKHGTIIDSIVVHRKLIGLSLGLSRVVDGRNYAISTGYSQGFVEKHEQLQRYCEALALKLGARGPLNIQCRVADDEIKVFEVHPRFSGTTSIRADVGFNEPDVLIRHYAADEEFGRLDYQTDVAVIRALQAEVVPRSVFDSVPRA